MTVKTTRTYTVEAIEPIQSGAFDESDDIRVTEDGVPVYLDIAAYGLEGVQVGDEIVVESIYTTDAPLARGGFTVRLA
jgi:hypothetical protein